MAEDQPGEPPTDVSEWTAEQWKIYLKPFNIQFRQGRTKPFRVQVRLPKAVHARVMGKERRGQSWSTSIEASLIELGY